MSPLSKKFSGRTLVFWEQISLSGNRRTDDETRVELVKKRYCGHWYGMSGKEQEVENNNKNEVAF
ncbi:MAG: hypothetical protein GY799_24395 [Desulfobulbaceae bacterium]|nr:hypothetical protein [Desulfobulbaceae bacterium]